MRHDEVQVSSHVAHLIYILIFMTVSHPQHLSLRLHNRVQIQISVGDVDCDMTIRFQVIALNLKRLTCQQMDRHRAAGESIQHNHVVQLAFGQLPHAQPGIT